MSWKPEVFAEGEWCANGMAFETEAEAKHWADDLLMRWFVPTDARAVESDQPVNYKIEDNKLIPVK